MLSIVLGSLGILTTLSTLFDIYHEQFGISGNKVLTIFSLQENFNELIKINDSTQTFHSINGLKTLAG